LSSTPDQSVKGRNIESANKSSLLYSVDLPTGFEGRTGLGGRGLPAKETKELETAMLGWQTRNTLYGSQRQKEAK